MDYKNLMLMAMFAIHLMACKEEKPEGAKPVDHETIAVKTHRLQQAEGARAISSTGMLATENQARYAFKVGGVIDRVYVTEGESFKKGKLLASLKIDEIDAGFVQAKLGLEKAERDLQRTKNLYQDSVATLEQLQNITTAYEIAQKQLDAVAFNKEHAFIYAAKDGFVTAKIANEGEIVSGGMPVLAINESGLSAWVLKVGLADKDWAMVEIGNTAQVTLDAYPGQVFEGKVHRKSLAADMGSGSFQVEIKLDCQKVKPAVGMFGKALISTSAAQKYHAIPYDALIEADGKHAYVFVPLPNGKVKKQPIEIADFDNQGVKVKSGLENIEEVVVTNSAFLNENSDITIIK